MITPLKLYRMTKNIRTSDLAKKAKLSVSMLSRIENGRILGSQKAKEKISGALGVPQQILFGGK